MVESLAVWIPGDPGQVCCVCCFCHILNLVTRSVLSVFNAPRGKVKQAGKQATKSAKQCQVDDGWDVQGVQDEPKGGDVDMEVVDNETIELDAFGDVEDQELVVLSGSMALEEAEAQDELEEKGEEGDNID
jgi:hypothetical protein